MRLFAVLLCALMAFGATASLKAAEPLKVAYSDWPGWVAWEIGIQKGWFKEAGVDVEFVWMDYGASMEAYAASKVDAVCMTNGDALVTGATGRPSVGIIINDYSNGNDMVVAKPGIEKIADLKGKKIGVEFGFVGHLLLLKALESAGLEEKDVEIKDIKTNETPQALASGGVDAISAWQPNSGQALAQVAGSKALFSSADAPGIIYDLLYVSKESLDSRREDWLKVAKVWYKIVDFIKNEDNLDETLEILSARVEISPEKYEEFLSGTKILTLQEATKAWANAEGFGSVYGSSTVVDGFNVKYKVYDEPMNVEAYLDPSITAEVAKAK